MRFGPGLNWQLIVPVVSGALAAVGLGMLVCVVVGLLDGEAALAFAVPAAVILPLSAAGLAGARRLRSMPLRARDGFLAVTLAWLLAAVAGAVPFMLHEGALNRPIDAFFESMSGFTTTGASLVSNIEALPDAVLVWRSLSQWLGGVGIVVLVVAIAPATGLATQRVFYAETSGFTSDRLTPRIADTAKIIVSLYLGLSAAGFVAYWIAGMGPFDAVNHVMTTISTGGFSTRTASLGAFDSLAIEIVAMVLMTIAGINFAFYWRAMQGLGIWPQAAEVRLFLGILVASIVLVWFSLTVDDPNRLVEHHLRDAAFSVTTLLTGTGLATADFDAFNDYARAHLLLLMFIGGCAGSTTGGMKVLRVLLLGKTAGQEVQRQLRPKAVQVLRTRGRVFSEEVRRGVLGFFFIYVTVTVVATMAMLMTGVDLVTGFSAAAASINIIGPGFGDVGPTNDWTQMPDSARAIAATLMLMGRLEIFTVLVLLTPAFWRRNVA